MTIRFPNIATCNQYWGETIQEYKATPIPHAEAFVEFQNVRRWAMRSPTAQEIIKKVETSRRRANIICYRGKASTVFGANEPVGEGIIHWDVNARFTTNRGAELFHHYIALLHEFGHFIQWDENPDFYNGNLMHNSSTINNAARDFYKKHAPKGLNHGAINKHADTKVIAKKDIPKSAAWGVRVEMDNLKRHEWPMCREARMFCRTSYTDLQVSDGSILAV